MQEIILTCDLCKAAERQAGVRRKRPSYAVATLDVCQAHKLKYGPRTRMGRPSKKPAVPGETPEARRKRLDRERHQATRDGRHGGGLKKGQELKPEAWVERETTVLSLIPAHGPITTKALWEQIQGLAPEKRLVRHRVHETLKRLKKKGFVKQIGTKSVTKYERANSHA